MIATGIGRRISHAEAKKLADEYKHKKKNHLERAIGKEETRSIWFDYDFCIMLMHDLIRKEINGLRIYFGAYDNSHSEEKKDKMTAILVTTKGPRTGQTWGDDDIADVEEKFIEEYNDGQLCPPRSCGGTTL